MSKPRDVVVVRASEKGDREDEHFHSPEVQSEAASVPILCRDHGREAADPRVLRSNYRMRRLAYENGLAIVDL